MRELVAKAKANPGTRGDLPVCPSSANGERCEMARDPYYRKDSRLVPISVGSRTARSALQEAPTSDALGGIVLNLPATERHEVQVAA